MQPPSPEEILALAPPGESITLDRLCGEWFIHQLRGGHRFSTDDMTTAWTAARVRPKALRLLDLGSGIGSVGLMTLWRLPAEATLTMIEVQNLSHLLARRTIAHNRLEDRVHALLGDIRDPAVSDPDQLGKFDLITGSPPYFPLGAGAVSPHPQRAACRMELAGDVSAYCDAATRLLTPDGRFCFVHAAGDLRPEPAIARAGLVLLARREILFRAGKLPTISLFTTGFSGERSDPPPIVVRELDGDQSQTYQALRREMGAP